MSDMSESGWWELTKSLAEAEARIAELEADIRTIERMLRTPRAIARRVLGDDQ